jgi:hypothetical protein
MSLPFSPRTLIITLLSLVVLVWGVAWWLQGVDTPDIALPDHPGFEFESDIDDTPDTPPVIVHKTLDMDDLKLRGCIADGFLSDYGENAKTMAKMVDRSGCKYLHRALETWLRPADFKLAAKIMKQVKNKDIVYGMFLAEAIDTKADLEYVPEGREFDFGEMCTRNSKNKWGEHTCIPSFEQDEYILYLQYVMRQAIDMGIQSFMFGQLHLQGTNDKEGKENLKKVLESTRTYAKSVGVEIAIGAQTNDIDDESFLRQFDYIEGGVGLSPSGNVESGPCYSRWWKKPGDWCWALLWHERFESKANAVLVHLDWSGRLGDDMSTFARMEPDQRRDTLRRLHDQFISDGVGFLLPLFAPLPANNGSCYGPKKRFYSADNRYTCQDEDAIADILD